MIPQFKEALSSGFTPKNIIEYLIKQFPTHKDKIKQALAYGYTAEQIMSFLSGGQKEVNRQQSLPNTEYAQMRQNDISKAENINKGALAAGALGATALASPIASRVVGSALGRALPQNLTKLAEGISPELTALLPNQMPTLMQPEQQIPNEVLNQTTSQPPVNAPSMPQVAQPVQAEGISNKLNVKDLLSKHGILNRINQLKEAGVSNEEIAKFTKETSPLEMSKLEKETGESADKLVSQYLSETTPKEEKAKPIAKNSTVIAPQGVGEVKSIKDKSALIDIDGKTHKVDVEDLEQEPEDVIQTVQELLQIPEVDRSSVVSLFTYDPEDKQMIIQFHDGESYKYLDVDPEKMMTVANKMGIPVTKGKNIFGAWSPEDKKSLGATLIKEIINDPKYKKAKKGEEANPNYRQMDTLFDYWEKLRKKPKKKKNA